jgi:hypothetical protein
MDGFLALFFHRVDADAQRFDFGKNVLKLARAYSDRQLQSPHDIGQTEHDKDEDRVEGHVADPADDGERIAHALACSAISSNLGKLLLPSVLLTRNSHAIMRQIMVQILASPLW